MSDAILSASELSATVESDKAPTYNVAADALQGVVTRGPKGEPRITVSLGRHAKNERLYFVRETASGSPDNTQTGTEGRVFAAIVRDRVASPKTVLELLAEGGLSRDELLAVVAEVYPEPEPQPEPSQNGKADKDKVPA